jgi:hypothetical protein
MGFQLFFQIGKTFFSTAQAAQRKKELPIEKPGRIG